MTWPIETDLDEWKKMVKPEGEVVMVVGWLVGGGCT
jgi:hypothetical protein